MSTDRKTITIEDQLKAEIIRQFGSIKRFSDMSGISYSTIRTPIAQNSIRKMSYDILKKICDLLHIDIRSIDTDTLQYEQEERVLVKESDVWADFLMNIDAIYDITDYEFSTEDREFLRIVRDLLRNHFMK